MPVFANLPEQNLLNQLISRRFINLYIYIATEKTSNNRYSNNFQERTKCQLKKNLNKGVFQTTNTHFHSLFVFKLFLYFCQ